MAPVAYFLIPECGYQVWLHVEVVVKSVVFQGPVGWRRRGPEAVLLAHWWGRRPAVVRWYTEHHEGCLWWRLMFL